MGMTLCMDSTRLCGSKAALKIVRIIEMMDALPESFEYLRVCHSVSL